MAPAVYPPAKKQTFLVKGEGNFTLTQEQREARNLVISVEKVLTGFVYDYFNFSTPEPETHWGYLQVMARDFVIETQQLQYRRQVVRQWDNSVLDPIEQLRCFVRTSTLMLFEQISDMAERVGNVDPDFAIRLNNYRDDGYLPRLLPTEFGTGVWYKIDVGRSAFVTIEWEGYAATECPFGEPQRAPQAATPGKGESGPPGGGGSGSGGAGDRPTDPPPPGQVGDPGSDNQGPTPGSDVPDSPGETPPIPPIVKGPYRVTVFIQNFSGSGPCTESTSGSVQYVVNPGPATVQKYAVPGVGYRWELFDNDGVNLGLITGGSITGPCDPIASVTDQTYIGP